MSLRAALLAATVAVTIAASQVSAARNPQRPAAHPRTVCPVDVKEPVAEIGAFQGNAIGHVPEVMATLAAHTLAAVRVECPGARLVPYRTGFPLLASTVVQWKQTRTDDPIGALFLPRNAIVIRLELLDAAVSADAHVVTFSNRARLTLNQPAERLLNDDFARTVRRLLN